MSIRSSLFLCILASVAAYAQSGSAKANLESTQTRFVAVGDSLTAGVENFSLLDSQQPHGYASVIAKQAGWPLVLPLVPPPGVPNVLQLVSLGPDRTR